MIKHYYKTLQQVISIVIIKVFGIKPDLVLQIFFNAIKNLLSSNKLISILIIFDAYFRIIELDVSFLSII